MQNVLIQLLIWIACQFNNRTDGHTVLSIHIKLTMLHHQCAVGVQVVGIEFQLSLYLFNWYKIIEIVILQIRIK